MHLPKSGGWLLTRRIDRDQADAMTAYPLFACLDWRSLKSDFDQLGKSLVSIVLVTDPFGEYDEALLSDSFGDLVTPFKSHYACDLRRSARQHYLEAPFAQCLCRPRAGCRRTL